MDPVEPTGYENEPREHFHELPTRLHQQFYHYERLSHDLDSELDYYRSQLQGRCTRLLELGCGTGILAANLNRFGFEVTGVDLDHQALRFSSDTINGRVAQMDIRRLGFRPGFDAALIGQNTINLLTEPGDIKRCLEGIRSILVPEGLLLAHLCCSAVQDLERPEERLMQFYIFDHPEGGKIIKETIRSYDQERGLLNLEQRFKIRRFHPDHQDLNYRHFLQLKVLSRNEWIDLFDAAGLTIESFSHGFNSAAASSDSTLHLVARTSSLPI